MPHKTEEGGKKKKKKKPPAVSTSSCPTRQAEPFLTKPRIYQAPMPQLDAKGISP
jgi:hypothetical protein